MNSINNISRLDTTFNYFCYFGPPGKHLCLSPLHLFYRCLPEGPTLQHIVKSCIHKQLDCLWASFMLGKSAGNLFPNIQYWLNITKTTKHMSTISRNFIFSKSKNPTPRITQDWGRGRGIGVLLIALTHTKCSYSYPWLIAVAHRSVGTSFNKLWWIVYGLHLWYINKSKSSTGRSFGWQITYFILFGAKTSRWTKMSLLDFGSFLKISEL